MGDFIKELNIIDFLGILLPGSLLILVLSYDYSGAVIWNGYFGSECSEATKAIFLIVAGYVVGSLIHEFGDIMEKMLWSFSVFDPKAYAARVVGCEKILDALTKVSNDGSDISLYEPCSSMWGTSDLLALIPIFVITILVCMIQPYLLWGWIGLFVILALLVHVLHIPDDNIERIRKENPRIQTKLVGKGNHNKRTVFDGFHVMMRNLMIVISLLLVLNKSNELTVYKNLSENFPWNFEITVGIILFWMCIRYMHYSYLKYKYSFENFIDLVENGTIKRYPTAKKNRKIFLKSEKL